jgi:myo-inositol 2-dehydrogenase / D-chiro-inositol 1-dehydrogenase
VAGGVRIGVIGVGRIGALHARLLSGQVTGATVTVVNDALPDAALALGEELGVPVAGSAEELMGRADVDAVAICTSTETHAPLIAASAEAGKAIFCEKPVSHDLVEVDRALAAVRQAGVPFQIGFNRRFDPAHQSVRDAVVTGRVGEPHLLRITSRDPYQPPAS